jgi:hypothetical protein
MQGVSPQIPNASAPPFPPFLPHATSNGYRSPPRLRRKVQSTRQIYCGSSTNPCHDCPLRFPAKSHCAASLALALACVGIYGVISYLVGQRTHEIGVRLALGAQRSDVLRMVLGEGARMALVGVVAGVVVALAFTRLMTRVLFGVTPQDPVTFVVVAILLTLVALAACYFPARRAMRVDPMDALRHE